MHLLTLDSHGMTADITMIMDGAPRTETLQLTRRDQTIAPANFADVAESVIAAAQRAFR